MNRSEEYHTAVKAIARAVLQSSEMSALMLLAAGKDEGINAVDVVHEVVTQVMTHIMDANDNHSVRILINNIGEGVVQTEIHYDYQDDSQPAEDSEDSGEDDDRLAPFAKFFEDKDL